MKQIEAKLRKKAKILHFLRANEMRKLSEMVVKNFREIFAIRFFLFAGNPLPAPGSDSRRRHLGGPLHERVEYNWIATL